jgi:maltose O-acetyltransferase
MRSPVTIGSHVIIGGGTSIITTSHNIDSKDWEHKYYGITIDDYAWIPTKVMVLPSCRHIGYGAVIGSGSVVVKDVPDMAVMTGNPAYKFKDRKQVHTDLVVESLLGGDYYIYRKVRKDKKTKIA